MMVHRSLPSRYRPLLVAIVLVGLSVAGLSIKWSLLRVDPAGWPSRCGPVLGALFAAGVMLTFAAATVSSVAWQRTLQAIGLICLLGLLVLPVNLDRWLPAPSFHYRLDDRRVTVHAKPASERLPYADILTLPCPEMPDAPLHFFLGPDLAAKLLAANRAMDFTVWRTRYVLLPSWRVQGETPPWEDVVETIRDGNQTLYDARICPIHHVMMQRIELPIEYGRQSYDPAWTEFSGGPLPGGDLGTPQKTAMGYRCPLCAERYEAWLAGLSRPPARQK